MKIEINNNRIFLKNNNKKTEIHPIWLRERANGQKYLDKQTDQRLFDPSFLENINIKNALIKDNTLELNFNDGANSKYEINKIASEFLTHSPGVIKKFPPYSFDHFSAFMVVLLNTLTVKLFFFKYPAIGYPITPNPIKDTF